MGGRRVPRSGGESSPAGRQVRSRGEGGESGHPGGESAKALLPGVLRRAGQGSELGGERGDPIPGAGARGGCWIASASGFADFIPPGQQGGTCRGCERRRFAGAGGVSGRAGWMEGRRSSGGAPWKQHGDKSGRGAALRAEKKEKETAEQRGLLEAGLGAASPAAPRGKEIIRVLEQLCRHLPECCQHKVN